MQISVFVFHKYKRRITVESRPERLVYVFLYKEEDQDTKFLKFCETLLNCGLLGFLGFLNRPRARRDVTRNQVLSVVFSSFISDWICFG